MKLAFLADAQSANTQEWVKGFIALAHEVHLLTFSPCEVPSATVHALRGGAGKLRYLIGVSQVRKILREIRPDILIGYYATGYGVLAATSGHGRVVIATVGSDILLAPRNPLLKRMLTFSLRRASLVTCLAPHMERALLGLGVSPEKILTCPEGINLACFPDPPALLTAPPSPLTILSSRSHKPLYNIPRLVEAVPFLLEKVGGVRVIVLGQGRETEKLVQQVKRLGIQDYVEFHGQVPHDAIQAFLKEAHLYVSLSSSDGVSASLLEAMAAGIFPVVSSIEANSSWIKDGETGILVSLQASPSNVADRIAQVYRDLPLLNRARMMNYDLVREKADSRKTHLRFVERLDKLMQETRS